MHGYIDNHVHGEIDFLKVYVMKVCKLEVLEVCMHGEIDRHFLKVYVMKVCKLEVLEVCFTAHTF